MQHFHLNLMMNLESLSLRPPVTMRAKPCSSAANKNSGLGMLAERSMARLTGRSVKVQIRVTGRRLRFVAEWAESRPVTFIKIDVEAFEVTGPRGARILSSIEPEVVIVSEVYDEVLRAAGDSASGLLDLLYRTGFRAFRFGLKQIASSCELVISPAGVVP